MNMLSTQCMLCLLLTLCDSFAGAAGRLALVHGQDAVAVVLLPAGADEGVVGGDLQRVAQR